MHVVCIIPARGGSKRIPGKNIVPLNGVPLLEYPIRAALASGVCDGIYVTTDSDAIADVAQSSGAQIIRRPLDLSGDTCSTESALLHAADHLALTDDTAILTLHATGPFITPETILRAVSILREAPDLDAVFTVSETRDDFWLETEGAWSRLYPNAPRRRQDRTPLFIENSVLYLTRLQALRRTSFILGKTRQGLPISADESIDINDPRDLDWAAFIQSRQGHE